MFETMLSGAMDEFPKLFRNRKVIVTLISCFAEFLMGLACITKGGIYVLQVMDWYCASFSLMLISLAECLVIAYVYGTERFLKDIELMIGYQPHRIWVYMWKYVTPIVIVCIWCFSVITLKPVTYGDYEYPPWAIGMGWSVGIVSLIPIPLCMFVQVYREKGPIIQRFQKLMKPASNWGPALPEDRKRYINSLGITHPELAERMLAADSDEKQPLDDTESSHSTPMVVKDTFSNV